MSIQGLVSRFGVQLWVYRPSLGVASDGELTRSYVAICCVKAFVQPSTQTSDVAQGRMQGRTAGTAYISGLVDIRVDDELRNMLTPNARNWRVTGAANPGEVGATQAAPHLNMTLVEVVEIEAAT